MCEFLEIATSVVPAEELASALTALLQGGGITDIDIREDIILCIGNALGIDIPIIS